MLTVACVRVGTRYGRDYVHRLRNMVERHLDEPHRFICLTDDATGDRRIEAVSIKPTNLEGLGWWSKMCLFDPAYRGTDPTLYLDLDTVVVGDLAPLARAAEVHPFAVTENFTRLWGFPTPCGYGSCVMTFGAGWGEDVWRAFRERERELMAAAGQHGDQHAIEALVPAAMLLNRVCPVGFFLGHRDLYDRHQEQAPKGAAVVVFGGARKPDNCAIPWVREAWK